MALSKPCAAAALDNHAAPALAGASNTGSLPLDAVYEILLRLPAKELCRLHAVCRPWRSLLSGSPFITAHAARHPEPLIVAGYSRSASGGVLLDIMDLSGRVVKRVRRGNSTEHEEVMSARLGLVCIVEGASRSCRLLDPATGAVCALPDGLAEEHAMHEDDTDTFPYTAVAFGQVAAATGDYKVLRVLDRISIEHPRQLYEVLVLNGGGSHGRWRGRPSRPHNVKVCISITVTINGIVYFLSTEYVQGQDAMPDSIASFDLETEEWRPIIRGPLSSLVDNNAADLPNNHMGWGEFSLAELNGCLVGTHRTVPSSMDLWFLMDVEKGLWVKQHSIQVKISYQHAEHTVRPLLVLDDGRIVLTHIGNRGLLKIYSPRTGTSTDVAEIGPCVAVGLYTGNLLSLADGAG